MSAHYREVTCPVCAGRGEHTVLTEVLIGVTRQKCWRCKKRIHIACSGSEVRVNMVDPAPARVSMTHVLN